MSSTPRRTSRATEARQASSRGAGSRREAARAGRSRRLRLVVLVALMVALPVAAVSWLGLRSARYERERIRLRLSDVAEAALDGIARAVRERIQADAGELRSALDELPPDAEALRRLARSHRLIRQVFLLDAGGELRYPAPGDPQPSSRELSFLERTRAVWERGLLSGGGAEASSGPEGDAWLAWVWGADVSFLYWRRQPDNSIRGVEVEASALLADVIAALPDTPSASGGGEEVESRITLTGMDGVILYQWGGFQPAEGDSPLASSRLDSPLEGWSLEYNAPLDDPAVTGSSSGVALAVSIGAFALLLGGAGVYLWRESSRDAREALRRTSFVNQVSHELKTPLTNIRLYAELLEKRLAGAEGQGQSSGKETVAGYLAVIVDESRRLSRLIINVLSFARRDRGALEVRRAPAVVDEIVRSVLADFRPSLEQRGVAVDLRLEASSRVWVDADALEQILANLVGNVEKYAAEGRYLGVATGQEGERTEIRVRDRGPGIPPAQRERVFHAFYRVSNRLADGVAGTGIGLTIARELARLHGGDLALAPSGAGEGAEFVVSLATPRCEEGA